MPGGYHPDPKGHPRPTPPGPLALSPTLLFSTSSHSSPDSPPQTHQPLASLSCQEHCLPPSPTLQPCLTLLLLKGLVQMSPPPGSLLGNPPLDERPPLGFHSPRASSTKTLMCWFVIPCLLRWAVSSVRSGVRRILLTMDQQSRFAWD